MADKVRRKHTLEFKQQVIAYSNEHNVKEAAAKFAIHPTQLTRWRRGEQLGQTGHHGPYKRAKRVAKEFGHKGNGAAPPSQDKATMALRWLERYMAQRGGRITAAELNVMHAYFILRGEE